MSRSRKIPARAYGRRRRYRSISSMASRRSAGESLMSIFSNRQLSMASRDAGRPSLLRDNSTGREPFTVVSSREIAMERHTKIEHLRSTLDEAITCAEQAGLAFVVLILDMARLEVDQSAERSGGGTVTPFGKRT